MLVKQSDPGGRWDWGDGRAGININGVLRRHCIDQTRVLASIATYSFTL